MAKVNRRGGFSDRFGISTVNSEIQMYDFDKRTRIQIYNEFNRLYCKIKTDCNNYIEFETAFFRFVLRDVYSQIVDRRFRIDENKVMAIIGETILNDSYDDVLTLIEAIAQFWSHYISSDAKLKYSNVSLFNIFNMLFKREYIGYRFVGDKISPISDEFEIEEINSALANPFSVVTDHLYKANSYLSEREHPDYENSIKESICAVEALCEIITGIKGREATLGNMLKKMESSGAVIHGSMKAAFEKLYGYTSDANGIRHAGDIGGPTSTFEEAKFMLVACSAFVNYLIALNAD